MDEKLTVAIRLLRREGREIPRHFHAMGRGVIGVLTVKEEFLPELHRHARIARLQPDSATQKAIPPLVDPVILDWTPYHWVLTGMERLGDGITTTAFAQSWWVFPVAVTPPPEWPPTSRSTR